MRKYWRLSTLGMLLILYLTAISCRNHQRNSLYPDIDDSSIANGEILAKRHCQSCHMLPDPSWLDARSWEEGVLPAMGPFLGIYQHGFQKYSSGRRDPYLDRKIYPDQPVMNADGWQFILDYYPLHGPGFFKPANGSDSSCKRHSRIRGYRTFFHSEPAHNQPGENH